MQDSSETQEPQLKKSKEPTIQATVDTQNQKAEDRLNAAGLTIINKPGFTQLPPGVAETTNAQSRDLTALAIRSQRNTERQQRELTETKKLTMIDPLSELHNYRWYKDEIVRQIARTVRTGRRLWLARIDFDDFKTINEMYGHSVGDEILKSAKALQEVSRTEEPVARITREDDSYDDQPLDEIDVARVGGEEFAHLIDEDIDEHGISRLMSRQMKKIEEVTAEILKNKKITKKFKDKHPDTQPFPYMTLSYGATQLRYQEASFEGAIRVEIKNNENDSHRYMYVESWEEFDKRADEAEGYAKYNGKNRGTLAVVNENNVIEFKEIPLAR